MDNKYDKVELNRHRFYLHKEFSIECHNIFSEEEKVILVKYGEWMRALVNGDISPITPAQVHFVEVFKKNISPQTKYEKIWKNIMQELHGKVNMGILRIDPLKQFRDIGKEYRVPPAETPLIPINYKYLLLSLCPCDNSRSLHFSSRASALVVQVQQAETYELGRQQNKSLPRR